MAFTFEIRYAGGFNRIITSAIDINRGKQISLRKPVEDRHGPDDYRLWVVDDRKDEMRETGDGVMESVVILYLRPVENSVGDLEYRVQD